MALGEPGSPGSQKTSDRAVHKIVCVPAESLPPLEAPDAYGQVPPQDLWR
jgi:hypothetical protein